MGSGFSVRRMARKALVLLAISACHAQKVDSTKGGHHFDMCKDFLGKHQLEAAKMECDKAIGFDPGLDEAYNARGLVNLLRAVDTERTLEIDQCLTGLDAEATHKELDADLRAADADFAKAIHVHPDYSEAWFNRGVVHNLLEDYNEAEQYLTKALENPARLEQPGLTRATLGWSLFNQKKDVEAARELRSALQFQPKMCVANYRLGRVYFAREEWDKAADLFQTVSDDPSCGSQEASLYLMKTRLAQGLVDDARSARDACLRLSPKSCMAARCIADGGALGPIATSAPPPRRGSTH